MFSLNMHMTNGDVLTAPLATNANEDTVGENLSTQFMTKTFVAFTTTDGTKYVATDQIVWFEVVESVT